MRRRDFIRTTAAGTAGMLYINSLLGCTNSETFKISLDEHFKHFQNPPDTSRLFVRWWWNGNRLDANDLYYVMLIIIPLIPNNRKCNCLSLLLTIR